MTPNIILVDATVQVKYSILHSYYLLYYLLKNNCIKYYDIKIYFHVLHSLNNIININDFINMFLMIIKIRQA